MVEAIVENDVIKGVVVENKSGVRRFWQSGSSVHGDADVAHFAGARNNGGPTQ